MSEDKKISLDDYLEKSPHSVSPNGREVAQEEEKKKEKTIYYIT
jgi:hypothetical protein